MRTTWTRSWAWPGGLLAVAVLLTGSVAIGSGSAGVLVEPATRPAPRPPRAAAAVVPTLPTRPPIGLRAGPVPVALRLDLPSIGVSASVLGVGILPDGTMDAPEGPATSPVWDQAFWYRGSAVPGARSTALIAGHVDGPGGRAAAFGHLHELGPGDPVTVRDTRTGVDARFVVTATRTYSLAETRDPVVLARIYGAGPVAGTAPQPSRDGLAHLTLITCAGTFRDGTHDHRLVVDATAEAAGSR